MAKSFAAYDKKYPHFYEVPVNGRHLPAGAIISLEKYCVVIDNESCQGSVAGFCHHTNILIRPELRYLLMVTEGESIKTATFAAGCFWGVEEGFHNISGVVSTEVGYTGGTVPDPTYEMVCSGRTGHAEAVRLRFDHGVVTYRELLDIFWSIHDPTQKDRQGPDIGTNYRSAIFYHDNEQKEQATGSRDGLFKSGKYRRPIVTEIVPAGQFWRAEEYHQQYFKKGGRHGCMRL